MSESDPALRACLLVAAALALAGCGNLSLANVLVHESPGDFRLSPTTANLQVRMEFSLTATGGIIPYDSALVSGSGTLEQGWIYRAPNNIALEPYIENTIRGNDLAGSSDLATIRVLKSSLRVNVTAATMQVPGSVNIHATGGVNPYGWVGDGMVGPTGDIFVFTATTETTPGDHVVSVTDALGNFKEVTITVLPQDGAPLTVFPVSAGVQLGGTVSFQAFGGTGTYTWGPPSDFNPNTGTPVTFTASTEGAHTITLTAGGASVAATVIVTSAAISALVLSPEAPTVTAVGDRVRFNATGGVLLDNDTYAYASSPSGYIDSHGLYTQIDGRRKVNVLVKDSVGATDVTAVYYSP
jgi:hypothetical protein